MDRRCDTATDLYGAEAEAYAGEHLVRDETDTEAFEERFACPDTGRRWLLDYPDRAGEEPGQARLRGVSSPDERRPPEAAFEDKPAASYSPGRLPSEYHRRWRA